MNLNRNAASGRRVNCAQILVGLTLALMLFAQSAAAQTPHADQKPAPQTYQTYYIANMTQQSDVNNLVTDLRNMIPRARLYFVALQNVISVQGTPEDMLLARKIISDVDQPRKAYRVNYSITETDGGKSIGAQHFALMIVSGSMAIFKQGSRVPIVTETDNPGTSAKSTQVQYQDVGLNIEASLYGEGLHTKVVQTSIAEQRPALGVQDPVLRQTVLEGESILVPDKPVVLGSLDIPGSTRHQEIEVVVEPVP